MPNEVSGTRHDKPRHLFAQHARLVLAQAAAAVFLRPFRHGPAALRHALEPRRCASFLNFQRRPPQQTSPSSVTGWRISAGQLASSQARVSRRKVSISSTDLSCADICCLYRPLARPTAAPASLRPVAAKVLAMPPYVSARGSAALPCSPRAYTPCVIAAMRKQENARKNGQLSMRARPAWRQYCAMNSFSSGMPSSRRFDVGQPAATFAGRQVVVHACVREIAERMAERRQLPVEHGDDARLRRMDDRVADAIVAVNDRGLVVARQMRGRARRSAAPCRRSLRSWTPCTAWSSGRAGARCSLRACRNRSGPTARKSTACSAAPMRA